jgi:DNA-3-methyladenine glycosylase II
MRDSGFELAVPQPFRFERCLEYMTRSPLECLYEVRDGRIIRLVKPDGVSESVLLELACPDDRELRVRFLQGELQSEDALRLVETYVREWFDLDRDLEPWQRMAEADTLLGGLARQFYGLRLIGIPDLFEALCWAIVGQQVNLAFAYKLKGRITEAYGDAVVWEGRTFRRFPDPAALADADPDELRGLQLTQAKAAALRAVAALMSGGGLSRAALLALGDFDAAERELVRVRGIGPWTAHYVRMRCLRDPRAFPIGDVGLHNAVKALLGADRKPTPPELQALFAPWAGWEAYATFYLWHSLY